MSKKLKLISFLFIATFCMFFIGENEVSAKVKDCTCYYYAGSTERSVEGESMVTYYSTYLVYIKYGKNKADVVYSCAAEETSYLIDGSSADAKKKCKREGGENTITRGNPFDVDSAKIAKKKCKVSACDSANISLWKGQQVVTEQRWPDKYYTLNAIEKKKAKKIEKADNAKDTAVEEGASKKDVKNIVNYGKSKSNKYKSDTIDCTIINSDLKKFLKNFLWIIAIVGIMMLLLMTATEFIKVVTGSEEDGLKTAFKHTVTRIICVIVLLLLPTLVSAVISILNKYSEDNITIGSNGDPVCGINLK